MNRHDRRASKATGEDARVRAWATRQTDGRWQAFVRVTLGEVDELHESGPYDTAAEAEEFARKLSEEVREIGSRMPGVRLR